MAITLVLLAMAAFLTVVPRALGLPRVSSSRPDGAARLVGDPDAGCIVRHGSRLPNLTADALVRLRSILIGYELRVVLAPYSASFVQVRDPASHWRGGRRWRVCAQGRSASPRPIGDCSRRRNSALRGNQEPQMASHNSIRNTIGPTSILESARLAVWASCAFRTLKARTFDAAGCYSTPGGRLVDLISRILALSVVTLYPMSALGAESDGGIGFVVSAVFVLGGPILGAVVVYAILNVPRAATRWPWVTDIMVRWRWSKVPKSFAKADIASILVPLVDHAGFSDGTIQIVGSDGGYLTGPKEGKLTKAIEKWTTGAEKEYRVRYILVAPNRKEAVCKLDELKGRAGDRLEVLVLSSTNKSLPKKTRLLKDVLITCHPVLVWSDDGKRKAMWIEANHPLDEDVSYNNQWIPPAAMGNVVPECSNLTWEDVFSTWQSQLDVLCDHIRKEEST